MFRFGKHICCFALVNHKLELAEKAFGPLNYLYKI
jgi:hypothetical protein